MSAGRAKPARSSKAEGSVSSNRVELDEAALGQLERQHPAGLAAAQIVELFLRAGERFSEATFRKWVQLGVLPRSHRVGRKGRHQGSLGLYPASTVRRIARVKQLMAESLTIEDIHRTLRFEGEIEALKVALGGLMQGFTAEAAAAEAAGESAATRKTTERLLDEARKRADELVRRLEELERRITTPLVRAARARAFASGSGGGAGDLL